MAIAPSSLCRAKQRSWFKPAMPHRRSRSARSAGRSVRSPRRTASHGACRGRTRQRRHAPTAPRGPACANRTPTRTTRTSLHRTATLISISHEGRRGRLPADASSCLSLLSRELISRRSGISGYENPKHTALLPAPRPSAAVGAHLLHIWLPLGVVVKPWHLVVALAAQLHVLLAAAHELDRV